MSDILQNQFSSVMRKLLFILIVLLPFTARAQDLEVLAQVRAIDPFVGGCGVCAIGTVVDYEVKRVIAGTIPEKRIFVVHTCIELQKPKISPGHYYRLTLTNENIDNIGMYSRNPMPKRLSTYYLIDIEPQ